MYDECQASDRLASAPTDVARLYHSTTMKNKLVTDKTRPPKPSQNETYSP